MPLHATHCRSVQYRMLQCLGPRNTGCCNVWDLAIQNIAMYGTSNTGHCYALQADVLFGTFQYRPVQDNSSKPHHWHKGSICEHSEHTLGQCSVWYLTIQANAILIPEHRLVLHITGPYNVLYLALEVNAMFDTSNTFYFIFFIWYRQYWPVINLPGHCNVFYLAIQTSVIWCTIINRPLHGTTSKPHHWPKDCLCEHIK